jgi:hypothetical protein
MNEKEIRTFLSRNDWDGIARSADYLTIHHHMTTGQILALFERLGGDRSLIAQEFFAMGV